MSSEPPIGLIRKIESMWQEAQDSSFDTGFELCRRRVLDIVKQHYAGGGEALSNASAGADECLSPAPVKGDASTRKDEETCNMAQSSPSSSDLPILEEKHALNAALQRCEISLVEWPLLLDLMQETFVAAYKKEYFKNPKASHEVAIEAVYHAISPYLRSPEPVSSNNNGGALERSGEIREHISAPTVGETPTAPATEQPVRKCDHEETWHHPYLTNAQLDEIHEAMNHEVSREEICKVADLLETRHLLITQRETKRESGCQKCDEEMLRVKACEAIAEGEEGWQELRNVCPSTMAVATLRAAYVKLLAAYLALRRLVELKEHKDKHGKDAFYNGDQPAAWRQAQCAINEIEDGTRWAFSETNQAAGF